MLFSNSPVKNIVEKLNPFSQKNKISRLKFERKGDYKTFLKFIKDSTKEIEDIKIPDSEDKKRKGLMIGGGLLGLGLLGFAARGKRDSEDSAGKLKSISGVIEKAKADSRKAISGGKNRRRFDQGDDVLDKTRSEKLGDIEKRKNKIKIRKKLNKLKLKEKRVKDYLKRREQRKITKQYANAGKVTSNVDPYIPKDKTKITASNIFDPPDKNMKGKKITISGGLPIDEDAKIGFPSEKDIKKEKQLSKKQRIQNFINRPKNVEQTQQDVVDKFNRDLAASEEVEKRAKEINKKNTNKLRDLFKRSFNQPGASKVNPYNRFDPTQPFMDDDLGQRTGKTTDKLELKPPKKLTQFDKFNRFSNRILNSPAAKFTTFMGGLLANPKFMILKSLMEPTPLADGTLEGKPGVSVFSQQLMFDEDTAVNIFDFSEGRKSAIPFDANIKEPLVPQPSNLQAPINDIFIDFEFNTTEDLFFMKMGGS